MNHAHKIVSQQIVCKDISDNDEPEFTLINEMIFFKKPQSVALKIKNDEIETECFKFKLEILDAIKTINFLREDKQYNSAYDMVMQLFETTLKTQKLHLQEICEKTVVDYAKLRDDIIVDYEEIKNIQKWFQLQVDWIVESSNKKMMVRYQMLPQSQSIVVRIDTEVNLPLTVFLSLIYETDLYSQWFPFCKEMKTISEPDKATKILRNSLSIPLFSEREMYVKGWGVNNMEHEGKLLVLVRSIDQEPEQMKKYNLEIIENSKVVRGFLHLFSFQIEPISINKHKVTVIQCFDLKLGGVPNYFPNLLARKFAEQLFTKLLKIGDKYAGSQWEKNQQKSPIFYEWIHQRVKDFLNNQDSKFSLKQ